MYFSTGPMHSSLHAKCVLLLNYMFTDILYVYALFACPYVPILTCVATMFIESKDYKRWKAGSSNITIGITVNYRKVETQDFFTVFKVSYQAVL